MPFVYIHIVWFSCWIGFGVEGYPYGLLTMIVSLEAIFLSTFVMISENRADAKRQVIADSNGRPSRKRTRRACKTSTRSRRDQSPPDRPSRISRAPNGSTAFCGLCSAALVVVLDDEPMWFDEIADAAVAALASRRRVDQRLAAGNAAVAAVWHSRRARFVVSMTATERR